MAITLTQLRSFLAVLRTGSVTAAAEELVVTQPSVSAAVSALSREIGADLTERVGRSVRPSPAGAAFGPYAADVIGLLDQGGRAAREIAQGAARELRIAAVTTAGEHLVPALMRAFSAGRPEITLSLHVGNRERVFERVRTHQSDVAIAGRPPSQGGIVAEHLLPNPIVIVTGAGDDLARRRSVPVEELAGRPWLLREEGSGTRAMTEEFLASHALRPRLLTLGSNGAIKQAARAGLGISLQPHMATELELELGLLEAIHVDVPLPQRHWYVLRAEEGPIRPPVDEFVAFVRGEEGRAAVERSARAGPFQPPSPASTVTT